MPAKEVRTRYAPSPTGFMHVGNLRTALYEYLIARSSGGKFILRIEDTDQERKVEGAAQVIYDTLASVSIHHDEGPDIGGPYGPYVQSERLSLYKPFAEELVKSGHAYYCFCSKERLDSLKNPDGASDETVFHNGYDRHCRSLSVDEIENFKAKGTPCVIRQKMPVSGSTTFHDAVYGSITVENSELEDQILIKSDGFPTYNFANVIDDHLMDITHVVRGSEYLSSTPKYNLLYESLGWEIPVYVHLPLIQGKNPDGTVSKLSKRHGSTSYEDLLKEGYLSEAIVNYIALLGWCPKDNIEIMSMQDLISRFSIDGISKSPAIFDYDKLRWFNSEYIRALPFDLFHAMALPYYDTLFGDRPLDFLKISELLQPRLSQLTQIPEMISFLKALPSYPAEFYIHKKMKTTMESSLEMLHSITPVLDQLKDWNQEQIHDLLIRYAVDRELKNGQVMWPVRTALSGVEVTPGGAVELLAILGKDESLRRIQAGIRLLEDSLAPLPNNQEDPSMNNPSEIPENNIIELSETFVNITTEPSGGPADNTAKPLSAADNPPENPVNNTVEPLSAANFIHEFIREDIGKGGRFEGKTVHTRFPPEPNGYLHIGHAKAIYIDFGTAETFNGLCNLRMDDTNPSKEDVEYVDAIKEDIHWLGYSWGDRFHYASDYFPRMYQYARQLIRKGLAFICELSADQMRESRGTLTTPGIPSPYRDRAVEESLDLFERMKNGEFADGSMTLRAKIDLASGNFNMRDPVIYRIMHAVHHRTGDYWCIYPMYDFAHPIEDAMEGITHSLCSLEFEDHRPLYDWVISNIDTDSSPRQIEFARLGINYTVMSKRKLRELVETRLVCGWNDPRMPTLCGLRRRGYTSASIRSFCEQIGVSKVNSTVDYAFLEHCLREDLNKKARRVLAVLNPVKLVIENYPAEQTETFELENNPENPDDGVRTVSFSRECWIEQEDFMEVPAKGYHRLSPGIEVRLKSAYVIRCTGCKKNDDGTVFEVIASYDPQTRGGSTPDGRKVKSTIHWADAANSQTAEVRLYEPLFLTEDPDNGEGDFKENINPDSLVVLGNCRMESSVSLSSPHKHYQFFRLGYFHLDEIDSTEDHLVFNRTVSLKDSYKQTL